MTPPCVTLLTAEAGGEASGEQRPAPYIHQQGFVARRRPAALVQQQPVLRGIGRPYDLRDLLVGQVIAQRAGGTQVGREEPHVGRTAGHQSPPGGCAVGIAVPRLAQGFLQRRSPRNQPSHRRGVDRDLAPGGCFVSYCLYVVASVSYTHLT